MNRIYLGDGVYVHIAHYGLVLTVEDGLQVGGEIALSEKAYAALVAYVDRYVTHGNTVAKETESK